MQQRTVFFVSDSTGITAEAVGHLLAHFPDVTFRQFRYPFIDSIQKVEGVVQRIEQAKEEDNARPIIVMTLVTPEFRTLLKSTDALCLDMFGAFIDPLSAELDMPPSLGVGITHGVLGNSYHERMDAINFSLGHDDGQTNSGLEEAQVILIGVSRCGKTPTSLYLAMQFGVKAANYPLIPEDFERMTLPAVLDKYPEKLYGLTIDPERLHSVRSERRPDSFYASIENCREEVRLAESLMERAGVTWIDSTSRSIEELATTILQKIRTTGQN
ncbi:phosphoenolpyruvate synthase regulatory protein [Methylovorus sp. MM2]|uniref:posphoenolpyruvate synthetase regulatory kinase/phosphorylase PpsR n=1 Tax=Methylovorus sp. MM2 TaxID=1848038 RepID=UPI0007E181A4|nr:pyruvate, water dikinase regulatory protein [Methylovorus sp. MM2]OAM51496.1 phosphoenolpyruvate synthase regulatory protein [Methylovorus sp. MM2]